MQPEQQTSKGPNRALISIIVIVVIAALSATAYAVSQNTDDSSTKSEVRSEESNDTNASSSQSSTTESGSYTNGSYTSTGSYSTPGGRESVTVTLTLSDGTITEVETIGSATGGNSKQYQSQFLSNYKSQVVGKSIDEVSLSRVAGSSLTSNGFNDAIDQIQDDARA